MLSNTITYSWERSLKAGSWVIVRSKDEILASLDEQGQLDDLPFQPEMFEFCGQRLRIAKVAHKTCDNIEKTGGRWMRSAYHLEGARCNGANHGGCQADCVFFWKADWIKPADDDVDVLDAQGTDACTEGTVRQHVVKPGDEDSEDPAWVCQTTALYAATEFLPWWDVRQYMRDITSGNHSAWYMTKLLASAIYRQIVSIGIGYNALVGAYNWWNNKIGGDPYPDLQGKIPHGKPTPTEHLNLQVGEWVEVKSGEEIAETLTDQGFNRGMRYDPEMLKYSGHRYKVQMRVDKIIDEVTGKMVELKNPCIQLEDVYCRAKCTAMRLGCPRASNTYWREIWLKRVDGPMPQPITVRENS